MKTCVTCGESKPHADFNKKSAAKDGLQSSCKLCARAKARAWNEANPERYKASGKERKYHLSKHGITLEEWDTLLDEIDHRCQICGKQSNKLFVDHDHSTNAVRGALCTHCNRGLGAFYDSPEILARAIDFLQSPPLESKKWVSRHTAKAEQPHAWLPGRAPRSNGL